MKTTTILSAAALMLTTALPLLAATISTKDGLALVFDETGQITSVTLDGKPLPVAGKGGFTLTEMMPPKGQRRAVGLLPGTVSTDGGNLSFRADAGEGLSVEAKLMADGGLQTQDSALGASAAIRVSGAVRDSTGKDRAVVLRFVLPVQAGAEWQYGANLYGIERAGNNPSPQRRIVCEGGVRLPQMPFNSLSDPQSGAGLALGVPMSHPAVCFFDYSKEGFAVEFDLGLIPDSRKFPRSAPFHFVLYRVDGAWGFRSAARKFYDLFGELYTRRSRQFGSCAALGSIIRADVPNKADFGITFGEGDWQWTDGVYRPAESKAIKELGLDVFHWREPWSHFHFASKDMTPEQVLADVRQQAQTSTTQPHSQFCKAPMKEVAQSLLNCYMEDADGRPILVRYEYGCWFFAPAMDIDLPRPNRASIAMDYQFFITQRWAESDFDGPRNIAWDSCSRWTGIERLNFRRALFATAKAPLTFDPRSGRVCQLKGLSDWEFATLHSQRVHDAGGMVMANAGFESVLLFGHTMDVAIYETAAGGAPEMLGVWRAGLGAKPMSFYGPADEAGLKRCVLLALAPGGVIDQEAETYRPIAKRYMPAILAQAKAGWQPVTCARSTGGVLVERFGVKAPDLYLAVLNPTDRKVRTAMTIDARALGFDPTAASVTELTRNKPLQVACGDGVLEVSLDLDKDEPASLQIRPK